MSGFFSEAEVAQFRADARARMDSVATVKAEDAGNRVKRGDGTTVTPWIQVATGEPCRVAMPDPSETATIGDAEDIRAVRRIDFIHDRRFADGQVVELTAGEWAGTFWRLRETTGADQRTALRLRAEQINQPRGWTA